jgi:hypothetical protein
MAKQTFTTGQVLTAAQMTSLQQTAMGGGAATAKTASYVLTAADAGTTIIMNSGSATTITVNTALFSAGDTVFIVNQGAGVCTITAGTATVTTAGSLAMGANETGELYFLSTSAAIFSEYTQAGGSSGALTLITAQTIGSAVSSIAVTSVFSSTYDNYKIMISGGTSSANNVLYLQLGATTTGYYAGMTRVTYSTGAASLVADNNAANFTRIGASNTNGMHSNFDILAPNLAKNTFVGGFFIDNSTASSGGSLGGFLNDTTAYTGFTILMNTGNLTGGTIRVYGYQNS